MTKNQDFKALVRARMAKTGESYTAARAQVVSKGDDRSSPEDGVAVDSGLSCGRCGAPIIDADSYARHLADAHGRPQERTPSDTVDRDVLVGEFEAAIADLVEALRRCPDELWEASMWHVPRTDPWVWPAADVEPIPERTDESIQQFSAFWSVAYHCLWFLDFYLSADGSDFRTPTYVRGGTEEMAWPADGAAPLADRVFGRDVLLRYAEHGRTRMRQRISGTADQDFEKRCPPGHPHAGRTLRELLDVNLRHVREHGGQMIDFVRAASR